MLLLPMVLVIFVLSKNCTPYELHREIKRCIAEGLHGFAEENCKHLLERCLAAGQSTSSTKCSSVLALKFNAVMTSDDTFAEWCVHASLLLLVLVHSATRRLQSQFRVQHSFKPHKHRPIVQEMVKSVKLMAESVLKMSEKNVKIAEQAAVRAF